MDASHKDGVAGWRPPSREQLASLTLPADDSAPPPESGTELRRSAAQTAGDGAAGTPADEEYLSPLQQLVGARSEGAGLLLRTLVVEEGQAESAAVVLIALGRRQAAALLAQLDEGARRELVRAIAALEVVDAGKRREAVEAFTRRLHEEDYSLRGGTQFARQVLEGIAGRHGAQELLDRLTGDRSSGFYMLKNVAPEQVAPFLSHEHPQTIALILSQLAPAQGAGILSQLPERLQGDVAYRIATMENITPAVLKEIEEALEASLRDVLGGNQDVGGPKVVADIINLTGSSVEKSVLDQMDAQGREVAEAVRNLMFTFADIAKLTDRELQVLLSEVDQKDLVIAMKAADEELKTKVLKNMSERVRQFITEEMEFLGPMRLSEVEEVQLRIVQQVRRLEERGQVTIVRGDAPDVFV